MKSNIGNKLIISIVLIIFLFSTPINTYEIKSADFDNKVKVGLLSASSIVDKDQDDSVYKMDGIKKEIIGLRNNYNVQDELGHNLGINSVVQSVYNTVTNSVYITGKYAVYDLSLQSDTQHAPISEDKAIDLFSIKNKEGLYIASFTQKAKEGFLRFSHGKASLVINPLNPHEVSGSVKKNTITYENIYPYTNIRYTLEGSGLKEDIIVQKYTGMSEFNFQLSISNAIYKNSSNGEICFLDPDTYKPLFYMAKPFAIDKNGNRCDLVDIEMTKEGLLKLSISPDWLKNAVYPITIDPTIYLSDVIFGRSSTANTLEGVQIDLNQPRYETGKFGQAIMVEEGTTNLLASNQAHPTSAGAFIGGNSAFAIDPTTSWTGSSCGKFTVLSNGQAWVSSFQRTTGLSPNTTYTFSARLKTNAVNTQWQLGIDWFNSSGNYLTTTWGNNVNVSSNWSLMTLTAVSPPNATQCSVKILIQNGVYGNALWFDGLQLEQKSYSTSFINGTRVAENITAPYISFNRSFTVESWVKIPLCLGQGCDDQPILFQSESLSADKTLHLTVRNGRAYFGFFNDDFSGTKIIADNNWHYVAFAFDANTKTQYIYVDGVLDASRVVKSTYLGTVGNTYIGRAQWSAYLNGLIDDLRISNRARSSTEIQANYQSNQKLSVDNATIYKMSFDGNLETATYIMTDTGDTTIFNRSSTANTLEGVQIDLNQPRYETGKFGQAIMVEEGTTNLLASNQAHPTSADEFIGGNSTFAIDPTTSWTGSSCGKFTVLSNGQALVSSFQRTTGLSPNTTYTFSARLKTNAVNTQWQLGIDWYNSSGNYLTTTWGNNVNISSNWSLMALTAVSPANATECNIKILIQNGVYGNALWFDGLQLEQKSYATSFINGTRVAENITAPYISFNRSFTVESWVKLPLCLGQGCDDQPILFQSESLSTDKTLHLTVRNGRAYFGFFNDDFSGTKVIADNNWHYVAFAFDANTKTQYIYVDGVLDASHVVTSTYLGTAGNTYIGRAQWSAYLNGLIDDIRISNRTRSSTEIQANYQSNQQLPIDDATIYKTSFDGTIWDPAIENKPGFTYIYNKNNQLVEIVIDGVPKIKIDYDSNGNLLRRYR